MYSQHQPEIAALARSSPQGLARAACLVFGSIRQPFARAVQQVRRHGPNAPRLAFIRACAHRFVAEAPAHYTRIERTHHACDALDYFASHVPGLALAKAGFLIQMVYGDVGCVDSVNAALYGVPASTIEYYSRYKQQSRLERDRRLRRYLSLTRKLGGSAHLWDQWCSHVASRGAPWLGAEHVSATHVSAIKGAAL